MRTIVPGVRAWRHDLAGCLHACAATLLEHRGVPALEALGSRWGFYYPPGDFRQEEYYFPCPPGVPLLSALAPYHRVSSRWHEPADARQGWADVRERVASGTPVAVAVDNFELPFRPAHRDVHANHLVIVYGFDDEAGTARVLDAVPPRFDGDLPLDVLAAARGSGNEARHERDMFFADSSVAHRWLEIAADDGTPGPPDPAALARWLRRNLDGFAAPDDGEPYEGLSGLTAFLRDAEARLAAGEKIADELFVVAGGALAATALHADLLAHAGRTSGLPVLGELGRTVARVAHHWTALRILAALTRDGDVTAGRLRRRHDALLGDTERALLRIESALPALDA
ncbi:BtrH N-terminal domain-containing protein [Actinomadura graeca]|uniref:BtrH N-terminal domain-containing protein n=1 Tax=Actinomadura graeca TaxID=2750812 RepID=A0ABX8QUH2_9ACTN|nr:BtrH N-terminal domain-containing protein [Actinomadura graeca]QXJ22396.1 BtrH N-terminal domain-containing protein [Actinomadura graeca]